MVNERTVLHQRSLKVLFRWTIDIVVALHTDTRDRHASLLHLLHHIIYTVALHWVALIIVVVEQDSVRVSLVSILKRLANPLIAVAYLVICRFAVWILCHLVVTDCLIDNIPSIDDVLITVDDGSDVLLHTCEEHLLLHQLWIADDMTTLVKLSLLLIEHPLACLVVPSKTVTTELDFILTAEISDAVSLCPVPHTISRMDRDWLHVVLSSDTVKLRLDKSLLLWHTDVTLIDSDTDTKIILVCLLQTCVLSGHKH